MTGTNDDDRRLADWLQDGPFRASERMIDAALAHARTHPRRRDPLASLRKDPMSSNSYAAAGRPLTLVAAATVIVVALFAATVGGAFRGQPAVVIPTATPTPVVSPTVSPTPAGEPITVDLIETVGGDAVANVFDASRSLVSATSGQPGDGASVGAGAGRVTRLAAPANTFEVTWSDFPCANTYAVSIPADLSDIRITGGACSGDATAVDRVLRLTFDPALEFARPPTATVTDAGQPITIPVRLDTLSGKAVTATVSDESRSLVDATSGSPREPASVEPGVVEVRYAAEPNTIILTWADMACGTRPMVRIDADLATIAITRDACDGSTMRWDRVLRLTFDHTVNLNELAATFTVTATPDATSPASSALLPTFNDVQLVTTVGPAVNADIYDDSGSLVGAISGQPREGGSMPNDAVDLQSVVDDPFTIEITWTDLPCGITYEVTINSGLSTLVIHRGPCDGDTIPVDRVLRLTFDHHFDTTGVTPTFTHD